MSTHPGQLPELGHLQLHCLLFPRGAPPAITMPVCHSTLCPPPQAPSSPLDVDGAPESFPSPPPLGVTGSPLGPPPRRLRAAIFAPPLVSEPCGASSGDLYTTECGVWKLTEREVRGSCRPGPCRGQRLQAQAEESPGQA